MTLDEVPADTKMELTPELDRAFRAANCRPTCHACHEPIAVGASLQLTTVTHPHPIVGLVDRMICAKRDKVKLQETMVRQNMAERRGGGYSRSSRNVDPA